MYNVFLFSMSTERVQGIGTRSDDGWAAGSVEWRPSHWNVWLWNSFSDYAYWAHNLQTIFREYGGPASSHDGTTQPSLPKNLPILHRRPTRPTEASMGHWSAMKFVRIYSTFHLISNSRSTCRSCNGYPMQPSHMANSSRSIVSNTFADQIWKIILTRVCQRVRHTRTTHS